MTKYITSIQVLTGHVSDFLKLQFVLFGFAQHLASHFVKSLSNNSYRYSFSHDLPNCFASYSAIPESLVKYAG